MRKTIIKKIKSRNKRNFFIEFVEENDNIGFVCFNCRVVNPKRSVICIECCSEEYECLIPKKNSILS